MIPLTKFSLSACRVILALTLAVGHFVICACPAGAAQVSIQPAESSCCGHEEASEPRSCCGDHSCKRDALSAPDEHAVHATLVDGPVAEAVFSAATPCETVSAPGAIAVLPVAFQSPTHSPPSTLLFCVLTR